MSYTVKCSGREKKKPRVGVADHGRALGRYRASEKGQRWDESFLGLVTMVAGWFLGRLV